MAYTNAQATPRSDIHALAMQANADFNKLFIGDKVFPVKGEDVKLGIYMRAKLANAELLNGDAAPRANGDGYQRVNRKYDTDTFDAIEYGLEGVIDDAYESETERFMNVEATEASLLERSLRISYEVRVAAKLMNASTFTATAASVAYTEANLATINIPADVSAAKLRMLKNGLIPNAIVMSANVFERIKRSTLLQNQVFGVVPKGAGQYLIPSEADIANALGVDTVYVGNAPKNSAKKGLTYNGAFIWGDTYLAVCQVAGGEYTAGGVGRTIQWTKDTTGLFTPETYRSDERRSNILRVRQHCAEKVIDETACELVTTSYA
tara:strand:+ start:408 stop:1373 length:966 start_codon:yes stop_codon:yes gene_type:complete